VNCGFLHAKSCSQIHTAWASWKTFPKEKFPEEYQKRCEQAKAERELDGFLGEFLYFF